MNSAKRKILVDHDRGTKSEFFDIDILSIVSSVSAQKSKCPSSAQLGSEPSQLGLARAGKFQLEPISTNHVSFHGGGCVKAKALLPMVTPRKI